MLILGFRPDQALALAGIFLILGIVFFFSVKSVRDAEKQKR
jgi:hypothetical protein